MLPMKERRRFVRHPICYPLEFEYTPKRIRERNKAVNISQGGLLFLSKHILRSGDMIKLRLPVQNKIYKVKAIVRHAEKDKENPKLYYIGVSFYHHSEAFKVKLIEQVYLIDEYRALRSLQLGCEVDFAEASKEWIKKYSDKFDKLFWGKDSR